MKEADKFLDDIERAIAPTIGLNRRLFEPGCGHNNASLTVSAVDIGERREGEDWRVTRKEFEARCDQCGAAVRFHLSAA